MFMFAPQNQIFAIHVSWIFLASFLDILQFLVLTHSRIAVARFLHMTVARNQANLAVGLYPPRCSRAATAGA